MRTQSLYFACALAFFGLTQPTLGQPVFKILHFVSPDNPGVEFSQAPVETSPGVFAGTVVKSVYTVSTSGDYARGSNVGAYGALFPASDGLLYGVAGHSIFSTDLSGTGKVVQQGLAYEGITTPLQESRSGQIFGIYEYTLNKVPAYGLFETTAAGALTMLVPNLLANTEYIGGPVGNPIQGSDGNYYGAVLSDPQYGAASFYSVTPDGTVSFIYTLPGWNGSGDNGEFPAGPLLEVGRLFYGVNNYGSLGSDLKTLPPAGFGNVFSLSPSGEYKVIYEFQGGAKGSGPAGGLIYASDGFLYGTTSDRLLVNERVDQIFRIRPDGSSFSIVYTIPNGTLAEGAIVQGSDGKLYGVLNGYPLNADLFGAIFSLDLGLPAPLPAISYIKPAQVAVGSTVLIRGNFLLGLSGVSFSGVPATQFKAVGPYYANAVVPAGATSGAVTVTTPNGSRTSQQILVIQ